MSEPQSILIFLFGDLGDALLAVPALRALREHDPLAEMTVAAKSTPGKLLLELGLVNRHIRVDKHSVDHPRAVLSPSTAWGAWQTVSALRAARPDTVLIFQHLSTRWGALKHGVLSLATGAQQRIGLQNGRGWFLTRSVPDGGFGALHEAEYWMDLVRLLGVEGSLRLEFPITPDDRDTANELLRDAGIADEPLFAIHPGTGAFGPGRRWPAEAFAEAAWFLATEKHMHCVVVGTSLDADAAAAVSGRLGSLATNLAGKTDVGVLGAVLERCAVTVANDGGVGHVSAAVGTPVVSIFGPSNDRAWRPLLGEVVAAELPCRPCFYRDRSVGSRFGCSTRECLQLVGPDRVAAVAGRFIPPGDDTG